MKVALVPLSVFELALDYLVALSVFWSVKVALVPSLVADSQETLLAVDLQETLLVFG